MTLSRKQFILLIRQLAVFIERVSLLIKELTVFTERVSLLIKELTVLLESIFSKACFRVHEK